MKWLVVSFILLFNIQLYADSPTSSVYSCKFTDDLTGLHSLRMKEYFDTDTNLLLGKVDLLQSDNVEESTPTKVYQIQLSDNQSYMQIWYSKDVRVDAQMSSSTYEFPASYVKDTEKKALQCHRLLN